jgi:hypothetical protein
MARRDRPGAPVVLGPGGARHNRQRPGSGRCHKKGKHFFFEKRSKKRFDAVANPLGNVQPKTKVFCFIFSKKKYFLTSPMRRGAMLPPRSETIDEAA